MVSPSDLSASSRRSPAMDWSNRSSVAAWALGLSGSSGKRHRPALHQPAGRWYERGLVRVRLKEHARRLNKAVLLRRTRRLRQRQRRTPHRHHLAAPPPTTRRHLRQLPSGGRAGRASGTAAAGTECHTAVVRSVSFPFVQDQGKAMSADLFGSVTSPSDLHPFVDVCRLHRDRGVGTGTLLDGWRAFLTQTLASGVMLTWLLRAACSTEQ